MATVIARHSLPRHADDTFAVVCLLKLFPDAKVIETRDQEIIKAADIVVDVGGVYDPHLNRFDHHQHDGPVRPDGTPYSSFGLVWKKYGVELCDGDARVAAYVDETFVKSIDANDNGISTHSKVDGYRTFDLSSLMALFNPSWAEGGFEALAELQLTLASVILGRVILKSLHKRLAETEVKEAVVREHEGIIVLKRFLPWQDYVVETSNTAKVVIFPAQDGGFNVQAVPAELGNRAAGNRTTLPTWEQAQERLGSDLKFVHKGRFIGGALSFEGAVTLAKMCT